MKNFLAGFKIAGKVRTYWAASAIALVSMVSVYLAVIESGILSELNTDDKLYVLIQIIDSAYYIVILSIAFLTFAYFTKNIITMENKIENTGNESIILQDITAENITIVINGNSESFPKDKDAFLEKLESEKDSGIFELLINFFKKLLAEKPEKVKYSLKDLTRMELAAKLRKRFPQTNQELLVNFGFEIANKAMSQKYNFDANILEEKKTYNDKILYFLRIFGNNKDASDFLSNQIDKF